MYETIARPAPRYVDNLGANEYVIGGWDVHKRFGKKSIYIKSGSKASISDGVKYARERALHFTNCEYYVTPVGKRRGDNTQEEIALLFLPLLFLPNVHLPEEYIRHIADEAHNNPTFVANSHLNEVQRSALREKWIEYRKDHIKKDYSDLFVIFDDEKLNFSNVLVNLICAAEAGEFNQGERLNQIRAIIECVFERLMQMGMLPEELRGSDSECGKSINSNKAQIPQYIRSYIYSIIGIVNSGSHAWLKESLEDNNSSQNDDTKQKNNFIKYQSEVNAGKLRYLIRSLVFMTLTVIEWCAKEYTEWKDAKDEK